ncbi:MAG: hypothetical protein ACFFEM_06770 [Candidatus Thorarchaeota archaeon]
MIDDDFESVFRKMMEQFREAFGQLPEGNGTFRSWSGSFVNDPLEQNIEQHNDEAHVEEIDLGNSVMFLVQGQFSSDFVPKVKVNGEEIIVKIGSNKQDIHLHPGFNVDQEMSTVSYRNGVIEITAVRSEEQETSEGYLRIE